MAYKLSFWIALFLLFFNGGAVVLEESGAADYMNVDPDTGNPEELKQAQSDVEDYETGHGSGGTLFGLYNTLKSPAESLFNLVFPGGEMAINAGVPSYLVAFTLTGLAIIPGYDVMRMLRGI